LTAINLGAATLNGDISDSATTINLSGVAGTWPSAGYITVDPQGTAEVIFYGTKTGNTLSGCIRGAGGTSAASHLSGVTIRYSIVSAYHELIKDAVMAMEDVIGVTDSTDSDSHEYRINSLETQIGDVGAPVSATYLVTSANAVLTNEVVVSALTTNLTFSGNDAAARTITLGQSGSYTDMINIGGTLQIAGVSVTSSAAELNRLDGISANVTATNLNTLTGGGTTSLHTHTGNHVQNSDTGTNNNSFSVGDGANSSDKYVYADTGETNLPYVVYDVDTDTWMLSNDGVSVAAISVAGHTHTAAGGWTDDGTVVRLTTSADRVVIGANSSIYSSPLVVEGSGGITIHGDQPICHLRSRLDNNFACRFFNVAANKIWALYMLASTEDSSPNGFLFEHYNGASYVWHFLIGEDGKVTVNPSGGATGDFKVKGDTDSNLFFCDVSADQVVFGASAGSATSKVEIVGANDSTALIVKVNATQANVTAADTFVDFRSTTGSEGSIAGTAVAGVLAYNTFLGAHYVQFVGDRRKLEPGMLLENTGERADAPIVQEQDVEVTDIPEIGREHGVLEKGRPQKRVVRQVFKAAAKSQMMKARICKTPQSKAAYGVWLGQDKEGRDLCGCVGLGLATVAKKGQDIGLHDYLVSSNVLGALERQDDDLLHNYTVGKAMEPIVWKPGEKTRQIVVTFHCG